MATLNFPANPKVGDKYQFNNFTYSYDGVKWVALSSDEKTAYDLIQEHKTGNNQHGLNSLILNGGLAYRNVVINGGMSIYQRGQSFQNVANGDYTIDRWRIARNNAVNLTIERNLNDVPSQNGVIASLRAVVAIQDSTLDAGDYCAIQQPIEGVNCHGLIEKDFTVSFWVKSSVVGKYCVALLSDSPQMFLLKEYTIQQANVWEKKTLVVSGGLPSSFSYGASTCIRLSFPISVGTNWVSAVKDTWSAGAAFGTTGVANVCNVQGAVFAITAVQVENGNVATPFEFRPYSVEQLLCFRYFLRVDAADIASETISIGGFNTSEGILGQYFTPVELRTTPSWVGGTLSGASKTGGAFPVTGISKRGCSVIINCNRAGNPDFGASAYFVSSGVNTGVRAFNAEL